MFEFPESVDSIDKVPTDFQSLYAQDGDKFIVPESVRPAVTAFKKVVGALNNSRKEVDTYKKQVVDLSPLADFGQTPEEIKAAFEAKLTEGSKAKVDIDKVKQAEAQRYANEIKQKDAKITAITKQLYQLNVRNAATLAIDAEGGSVEVLMPHVEQHVQQVEEDGQLKAYVVDASDSTRRFSNVTGEPMTIRELVAEFKTKPAFAGAFKSTAKNGVGTQPNSPTRSTNVGNVASMSPTDKISVGLATRRK